MCSRGIFQLKQLDVIFCDIGGSSSLLRRMIPIIQSHKLLTEPPIPLQVLLKRGVHPLLRAHYINGYQKQISLRNMEDSREILDSIALLRNSCTATFHNRKSGRKVYSHTKSVQGGWNPSLFSVHPRHEMEKVRSFPKLEVINEEPVLVPREKPSELNKRRMDPVKSLLKPGMGIRVSGDI